MEKISFGFKLLEKENEETFEKSKILGSPVFPDGFYEENNLDDLLFVMQLNLNDLNAKYPNNLLPKNGFLYIFLDVDEYPYEPYVFYTNKETKVVYDDFNDIFDDEFGDYRGYELVFNDNDEDSNYILGDIDCDLGLDCEIDTSGYVVLLQIDSLSLPTNVLTLGQPDGYYVFLIKESDLKNKNFNNVKFIDFGS